MKFLNQSACPGDLSLRAKEYEEEVELVSCTADTVRKQQDIPLQPRDLLVRILEACTWSRHRRGVDGSTRDRIEAT